MSTEAFMKGLFSAIFSLTFSYAVFSRCENDANRDSAYAKEQRYLPLVSGAILPSMLLALVVFGLVFRGTLPVAHMLLTMCLSIFPHICLYYAVLMLLLPFLRRHISARACAMLWMIPNYLYLTSLNYMKTAEPLAVIRTSGQWIWVVFGIWFAGFALVLLWKIVSHLIFRREILKDARPVLDRDVLALWREEVDAARIKKATFVLVTSPAVSSPLTVGLFRRFTKVVLPERPYTPDELRLIFRHEIVHIGREDSSSKFFLAFCTAMCWFNPLMWIAMRKSADDMELSCDETVLLNSDEETRRQYAGLLLSTAGDGRGFTTCLSAAASSMRYRLKSIVAPRRRSSGAIAVGLVFFVLCMTCGHVALAYGAGSGRELLFQGKDSSWFDLRSVSLQYYDEYGGATFYDSVCTDETALCEYLAGLELYYLTGNYSFSQEDRKLACIYDIPDGVVVITLTDHTLEYAELYGSAASARYYLPEGADWDYLDTIMAERPYE